MTMICTVRVFYTSVGMVSLSTMGTCDGVSFGDFSCVLSRRHVQTRSTDDVATMTAPRRQWSLEVPSTSRPSYRGNIRRSHDPLATPALGAYGVRTLYEAFRRGRDINPLGPCLGFRATSSNSGFATPYVYGSYGECVARVDALAAGLEKGGEGLLDRNEDGMLLVSYARSKS